MTDVPSAPDAERRDQLLGILAELVARDGSAPLLAPPVKPGAAAFPERWKPTCGGVTALLRRLAWHAGGLGDRTVIVDDERLGAPPTEHQPQTRVELTEIRKRALVFALGLVSTDDVVGTLAHEIGVAYAALQRGDAAGPYRTPEPPVAAVEAGHPIGEITIDADRDLARGSLATVYLGLGVLAANAAFQQYSSRVRTDAYAPHVYEVHRAGYVPMSELAFLLAVQAVVRGVRTPPPGLSPPQRDEVTAWMAVLADDADALRAKLGIAADARGEPRPAVVRFDDANVDDGDAATARGRTAFRWQTHRAGLGTIAGMVLGAGISLGVAWRSGLPWLVLAGGGSGHVVGRRVRIARCSACVTVNDVHATTCRKCGAQLRGDIAHLSDRLEAEEQLEAPRADADADADGDGDGDADAATPDATTPADRRDRSADV